ncbi:MAG: glutamate--tRNA ligase [Syntrophorhabdaceae bacterium]|nr:glutamate--tRNA ligase [Syntrophorhabdaceae bacterium]
MVKVRFAPSPTGNLHVGNARTAILNYLFARKEKGIFCLRIEDTDIERSRREYESSIIDDLKWLDIHWDEGPIRQTERLEIYKEYADRLIEKGLAYHCFCTKDELEQMRRAYLSRRLPPRYNGRCRELKSDTIKEYLKEGRESVIRFISPMKPVHFTDLIHGEIDFPYDHVDDFIIMKSDNIPSYNFAAVIDDMLTGITHVIRGADHISNTPKQIKLFHAFEKEPPLYAHHSLLVGRDKKPLSKRHGVTGIKDFKAMGILKEAIINYLGITGRSLEKEVLSIEELIETFDLSSLSPSDSLFDLEKLLWLNKEHIKNMPTERLINELGLSDDYNQKVNALRENASTIEELKNLLTIFDGKTIDEDGISYISQFKGLKDIIDNMEMLFKDVAELDKHVDELKGRYRLSKKEAMILLRIIFTGKKNGPPLKDIIPLISKDSIIARLKCLRERLSQD